MKIRIIYYGTFFSLKYSPFFFITTLHRFNFLYITLLYDFSDYVIFQLFRNSSHKHSFDFRLWFLLSISNSSHSNNSMGLRSGDCSSLIIVYKTNCTAFLFFLQYRETCFSSLCGCKIKLFLIYCNVSILNTVFGYLMKSVNSITLV